MACQNCKKMEGDWTSKEEEEFDELFHVLSVSSSGLVSGGYAECKSCGQKVDYIFDYTLIRKLQIRFLEE